MAKHASLAPSKAHRWFECPGSVRLEAAVPKPPSSVYAEEGSVAHQMAERCLRNGADANAYEGLKASQIYDLQGDDFVIDAEMCENVQIYLDVVRENMYDDQMILCVEEKFKVTDDVWGTNDACTYREMGKLTIYDLKYGRGVQVDVEDNPQLMIYLLGAIETDADCLEFEIVIVQPRGFHPDGPIRRFKLTPKEVKEFRHALGVRIAATKDPNAPLNTGEHCRFCAASGQCPEQKASALKEFGPVGGSGALIPEIMSQEDVGRILQKASQFRNWLDALEKRAKELLQAGKNVPGMKLVRSAGRRKWIENADVEGLAQANDTEEPYKPQELVSPAQFEKLLQKEGFKPKERKEIMDGWTTTPSSIALVPESDKRAAIPNAIQQFDPVEQGDSGNE